MSRRLIIDGQVFQTPALFRGMGKYSIDLLESLLTHYTSQWSSIELILSKHFTIDEEEMARLQERLPGVTFTHLDIKRNIIGDRTIPIHNREVLDSHIAKTSGDVDYLILSLMQGEIHPVLPSLPNVRKMVLFYDLIPLMLHKIYLGNPVTREEYLFKLKELMAADLYLAISRTVANDLSNYLGVDRSRVVSIDGGPIVHGKDQKKMDISEPFILMPNGNDLRKNNRRGILAFADFNKRHNNKYSLVITSFFKDHEITELQTLSDNLIFTGNISGEEMRYLYANCEALLFPSEYEGLGLPILEAVEMGKPIACSDISVFREMSTIDFDVFDPKNVDAISSALFNAVNHRKINKKNYSAILKKYSWKNTAKLLVESLELVARDEVIAKTELVFVAPDLSRSEPLMRFNLQAYAELSRRFDVAYCGLESKSNLEMRINYLPYITANRGIFSLKDQLCVYSIDNSASYTKILPIALANPGILVLHDINLDKLWLAANEDKTISDRRYSLEESIDEKYSSTGSFVASLIRHQEAIIVFSAKAKKGVERILKKMNSKVPVFICSLPIATMRYPEILPIKSIPKGFAAGEGHYRPSLREAAVALDESTDFNFLEQVSQASSLLCTNSDFGVGSRNVLAYEAAARGTMPILDADDAYTVIEGNSDELIEFAEQQSYKQFAEQLASIVDKIRDEN